MSTKSEEVSLLRRLDPRTFAVFGYRPLAVVFILGMSVAAVFFLSRLDYTGHPLRDYALLTLLVSGLVITREVERRVGTRWVTKETSHTLDDSWYLAAVLAIPAGVGVLLFVIECFLQVSRRLRFLRNPGLPVDLIPAPPHKAIFNSSTQIVCFAIAHFFYETLLAAIPFSGPAEDLAILLAAIVTGAFYLALSDGCVALVVYLATGDVSFFIKAASMMFVPMIFSSTTGLVITSLYRSPNPFVTVLILPFIAIAYHALLRTSVVDESVTDETTGVSNKRYWMLTADAHLARVVRGERPLSLVVVDLDHFKKVNDTYGHLVGDVVLKEVATRIKGSLRPGDLVGRFGGEEFVILLPESDLVTAKKVAERCRKAISNGPLAIHDGREVHGTASFGVVNTAGRELDAVRPLLEIADSALYEAKEGGRNRVVLAPPSSASVGTGENA